MPESFRWLLLFLSVFISGCQSTPGKLTSWWPGSSRTSEEGASTDEQRPPSAFAQSDAAESDSTDESAERRPVASGRVDYLVQDGIHAVQERRLDDARKLFNEVLEISPNHSTAHQGLAMIADLSRQWSESEFHYKAALRSNPRDPGLLNDLGYSYLLQNRYSEAQRYLNQALEINPQHEKAQENLAMLSLRQGDRDAAEKRLGQLYPAGAVRQHLARLEQSIGVTDSTSRPTATKPEPAIEVASQKRTAEMTLDEVRQLAERERVIAEQERQRKLMANSSAASVDAAAASSNPNGPVSAAGAAFSQSPVAGHASPVFPAIGAAAPAQQSGSVSSNPGAVSNQPVAPSQLLAPNQTVAANQPLPANALQSQPAGILGPPMVSANPAPQQYQVPPMNQSLTQQSSPAQPTVQSGSVPQGSPLQPSGTIVAVHGTGGVSNPGVWNPQASQNLSGAASSNAGSQMAQSGQGGQQPPSGVQQQSRFPLVGLNAGPGTLFSVAPASSGSPASTGVALAGHFAGAPGINGVSSMQQAPSVARQPSATPISAAAFSETAANPILRQDYNSVYQNEQLINQQQFYEQQQRIQQQQQAQRIFATLPPGGPSPAGTPPSNSGFSPNSAMTPGHGMSTQAPSMVPQSPLTNFERQMQESQSQYQQALQQLNRQSSAPNVSEAQYPQ